MSRLRLLASPLRIHKSSLQSLCNRKGHSDSFLLSSSSSSPSPITAVSRSRTALRSSTTRTTSIAFETRQGPIDQRTLSTTTSPPTTNNSSNNSNNSTAMAKTVEDALRQGKLFTDDQTYAFLKLPISSAANAATAVANSSYFRGLLIDKDEITVMITTQDYAKQKDSGGALVGEDKNVEVGEFSYRMITFDAVLDPTLIGFMATITKALAAAEISVLPFAAYSRDHIFVQEGDFEKAMQVLEGLGAAAKKE